MTILLYKDGRLVIDDGNPLEGRASLEGLVACVADPQSGDTLKFDGNQWVAGAAASGLPTVSGDDNGKVLTVVEGAWAAAAAGGGGVTTYEFTADVDNARYIGTATFSDVFDAFAAGNVVYFHMPESTLCMETYLLIDGIFYSSYDNPPYTLGFNTNVGRVVNGFGATDEGYIYIDISVD